MQILLNMYSQPELDLPQISPRIHTKMDRTGPSLVSMTAERMNGGKNRPHTPNLVHYVDRPPPQFTTPWIPLSPCPKAGRSVLLLLLDLELPSTTAHPAHHYNAQDLSLECVSFWEIRTTSAGTDLLASPFRIRAWSKHQANTWQRLPRQPNSVNILKSEKLMAGSTSLISFNYQEKCSSSGQCQSLSLRQQSNFANIGLGLGMKRVLLFYTFFLKFNAMISIIIPRLLLILLTLNSNLHLNRLCN